MIRDRRYKPAPWDWRQRGVPRSARWSLRNLVLAWPFWQRGDHPIANVPPSHNKLIVVDPIIGNHGEFVTNAGSPNTLLRLDWNANWRGNTLAMKTNPGGTLRQCLSLHMRDFPTTHGTFVYTLRKLDATNRVAAHYANTPTPSPFAKLIALCTPLEFAGTNARFYYGGNTAGVDLLVQGGLTYGDDVWVFTCGSRGMEIWQNGKRVGHLATTPTRTNDATDRFGFLGGDVVNAGFSNDLCETGVCLVYNRQLSEAEIMALTIDPWLPFRQEYRRPSAGVTALPELTIDGDGVILLSGSADIETPAVVDGTGTIALTGSASIGIPGVINGDGVIALAGAADIDNPVVVQGTGVIQIIGSALIFPLAVVPPGGGALDPDALPDADCSRETQADFETASHGVLGASTVRRPDAISLDYLTAYAIGPIAIGDLSQGYEARTWRARVDGADTYIARRNAADTAWEAETLYWTTTAQYPFDEIDFCFDSNGNPVIVAERYSGVGREAVIVWNDIFSILGIHIAHLAYGRTPRCALDVMPHSPDPDICPPIPEVQVVYMLPGTGMVRVCETEDYGTEHPTPLGDDDNVYLEDFYPTQNTRMRVAYVVRDPATGTYSPVRFHDSVPYVASRLANPSLPAVFFNIVFDQGQFWRNPAAPTTDPLNLRVGLPDTVRLVEVQGADDQGDPGVYDDAAFVAQNQVNDAEVVIGPGATYPAGGFVDFPFSIDHGGGTMSPRAWRARTMRIIDGHTCYSPWSYWFAGKQAINLVSIPGFEDTGARTQVMTWQSSDGGLYIQYIDATTLAYTEEFIPGPPASVTRTCKQVFDPSIVGGWRTVFRVSVVNKESITVNDDHDTYNFVLTSAVATEASSNTPLGTIPGPPNGGLQTPQVFPPLI